MPKVGVLLLDVEQEEGSLIHAAGVRVGFPRSEPKVVSYIKKSRLEVAVSLEDFLTKFTIGDLIDMPLYPAGQTRTRK
jgi:hypothetical protein